MPSWEIDFWGRIGSLKQQALAQYLATEEGRKAAQISLIATVANTWLNLQADEELLAISRRTLGTREQSIKLTKLRLDSGVASELDYRQAQSLTESARATLAQQAGQRERDVNALTLLVGQTLPGDLLTSMQGKQLRDLPALADVPSGLPSDLLLRRPDIRQAEQSMIAANASIGAARALFFPNITLTASAGFASSDISDLLKSDSAAFTIAPSLYLPIFNAGRNRANLQVAETSQKIAVAQYEGSIQSAFREVSDTLVNRRALKEQLDAQSRQLEAEQVRYKLSDLRYTNGVASYLDLLDAQRSLFALSSPWFRCAWRSCKTRSISTRCWAAAGRKPAPATTLRQQLSPVIRPFLHFTQGVFGRLFSCPPQIGCTKLIQLNSFMQQPSTRIVVHWCS
jgi:multidrug efflux system outer membrane protein